MYRRTILPTLCLIALCVSCKSTQAQGVSSKPDEPTTKPVEKPKMVSAAEWGSTPQPIPEERRHTPKNITIHHAGVEWKNTTTPIKSVKGLQQFGQTEKNWPDVPYHFIIGPDGTIFEGRSLDYAPDTNTDYDVHGHVGIELLGNFEEQRVSEAQLDSLVKLTAWLAQKYNIGVDHIAGHKDIAKGQTVCPGKDLYRYVEDGSIAKWAMQIVNGQTPEIVYRDALPDGPTTIIELKSPASASTTQPEK